MIPHFAVWYPRFRITVEGALERFEALNLDDEIHMEHHPALDAFYAEVISRFPDPPARADGPYSRRNPCPWSEPIEHERGFISLWLEFEREDEMRDAILPIARKHGLAMLDAGRKQIFYPDDQPPPVQEAPGPWKKFIRAVLKSI